MNLFTTIQNAVPDETKILLEIPGGAPVTYGDFIDLTGRLALALAAHQVLPGDRVAVQVEKSWQALALYLACQRAGAVFLTLDTAYTPVEIAYRSEEHTSAPQSQMRRSYAVIWLKRKVRAMRMKGR